MNGLLGKKEAADRLGISERTLDRERCKGLIPWVQVRGQVKFRPEHLEKYIDHHTKGGK
jgi:excisionase family DNA binding protein